MLCSACTRDTASSMPGSLSRRSTCCRTPKRPNRCGRCFICTPCNVAQDFEKFLNECRLDPKNKTSPILSIDAFLLVPVQRPLRLQLLMDVGARTAAI